MSDVARKYLLIYVTEDICGLTLQGVPNKQLNYVCWQHKSTVTLLDRITNEHPTVFGSYP